MKEVTLTAENSNSVVLQLNNTKKHYAFEDVLEVQNRVFNDKVYVISLDSERLIQSVRVYLNGDPITTEFDKNRIHCTDNEHKIFMFVIGFAQLSFEIIYADGEREWLYSEYVAVMIKSTYTNLAVDRMLKYVYENQKDILLRNAKVVGNSEKASKSFNDFWSQIIMFEEIANVYEMNYGYFKANCRSKLEKVEVLDRVEKIQFVDSKTLQYITQHPEYLKNSVMGIHFGGQNFLPSKTLMTQNHFTNDIYENQVVVSFLKMILNETLSLKDKIKRYVNLLVVDNEADNGYIVSSYLLYMNAKEVLMQFADKLSALNGQISKLVMSYSRILEVHSMTMERCPEATAIFMNLPQYNRIYSCIVRWFNRRGYDLYNERVMMNFISAPAIYEAYVLIKLINQIKSIGYELIESKNIIYPRQNSWKRNMGYSNTFVFTFEQQKITLYYEPVIYNEDRTSISQIGLYRNNSISYIAESDVERQGTYYLPDFVIKYEDNNQERYVICDAKFSHMMNVQHKLIPPLAYKYLTSISPIREDVEIKGLFVIYGLVEENFKNISFYNCQIKDSKKIEPQLDMIPLSEEIPYDLQEENLIEILRCLLK